MARKRRTAYREGAIVAVPLPRARWAYAKLQIRHKGKLRKATPAEIAGLDVGTVCQPEQFVRVLVDRLVQGDHGRYRVPR